MIKIAQFGEGNFLRTFADAYFDALNREGGEYEVSIIKPIPQGSLEKFKGRDGYHIVLRGVENNAPVEKVHLIESVKSVIDPFNERERFYDLAREPELKLIVSNTTEAGICFNENDDFDGFEAITYPAKLTKFLFERFKAGLPGVYLLPVELIDNNADELYACVKRYTILWSMPEDFAAWIDSECFFCNTLVDRIVSGYPRDEETREHLFELIGERDELVSVGEPFGLWAIEKKGDIASLIREGRHNIDVVITENIKYYKTRKVRVLNGSHTNLVAAGILHGAVTVYDCMVDEKLHKFFEGALGEIVPFVSEDIAATKAFAADVEERFRNPYLNHQLMSIALNSISKWRARDLPTFLNYFNIYGKLPEHLTVGFAYLMQLYRTRTSELQDDAEILADFAARRPISDIMADDRWWGTDLTKIPGFADRVESLIARLDAGEELL